MLLDLKKKKKKASETSSVWSFKRKERLSDFGRTWFDISLQHLRLKHKTSLLLCETLEMSNFQEVKITVWLSAWQQSLLQLSHCCLKMFYKPESHGPSSSHMGKYNLLISLVKKHYFPIYPHAYKVSFIRSVFDICAVRVLLPLLHRKDVNGTLFGLIESFKKWHLKSSTFKCLCRNNSYCIIHILSWQLQKILHKKEIFTVTLKVKRKRSYVVLTMSDGGCRRDWAAVSRQTEDNKM